MLYQRRYVAAASLLLLVPGFAIADHFPSRTAFADKMSHVEIGMERRQVAELLGVPDVVMRKDVDGASFETDFSEIWYYGVSAEKNFPTLGRVYFVKRQTEAIDVLRVNAVYGNHPMKPIVARIAEGRLRNILATLGAENACHAYYYNPKHMIAATNVLHELGKEAALLVIEEYLRICPESHGTSAEKLMLLLRIMFDPPGNAAHFPPLRLGASAPPPPDDLRQIPRFPVVICSGIPLLLIHGYTLEGQEPSLAEE